MWLQSKTFVLCLALAARIMPCLAAAEISPAAFFPASTMPGKCERLLANSPAPLRKVHYYARQDVPDAPPVLMVIKDPAIFKYAAQLEDGTSVEDEVWINPDGASEDEVSIWQDKMLFKLAHHKAVLLIASPHGPEIKPLYTTIKRTFQSMNRYALLDNTLSTVPLVTAAIAGGIVAVNYARVGEILPLTTILFGASLLCFISNGHRSDVIDHTYAMNVFGLREIAARHADGLAHDFKVMIVVQNDKQLAELEGVLEDIQLERQLLPGLTWPKSRSPAGRTRNRVNDLGKSCHQQKSARKLNQN